MSSVEQTAETHYIDYSDFKMKKNNLINYKELALIYIYRHYRERARRFMINDIHALVLIA